MKNQEKNENLQFSNQYNIQWFPGHMARTLRVMEQEIQHVDASLILLDARIPLSSLNPEIERITARKPRLYALNKADLADPAVTEEWIRYFRAADAGWRGHQRQKPGRAPPPSGPPIEKELAGLLARRQARGMSGAKNPGPCSAASPTWANPPLSTPLRGRRGPKPPTAPASTKGKQWVSTEKFDLLDMPGRFVEKVRLQDHRPPTWPSSARSRTTSWMWKSWP